VPTDPADPHEEYHIKFWRIPNGETLHHLLGALLLFPLDMRRASNHDADKGERIDVRPRVWRSKSSDESSSNTLPNTVDPSLTIQQKRRVLLSISTSLAHPCRNRLTLGRECFAHLASLVASDKIANSA
jgi:hypothetical protein